MTLSTETSEQDRVKEKKRKEEVKWILTVQIF